MLNKDDIKRLLKRKGWNYIDLAEASGVSIITIRRFLSGQIPYPRVSSLNKIYEALDIYSADKLPLSDKENILLMNIRILSELLGNENYTDALNREVESIIDIVKKVQDK